jgi:hypothetical protein
MALVLDDWADVDFDQAQCWVVQVLLEPSGLHEGFSPDVPPADVVVLSKVIEPPSGLLDLDPAEQVLLPNGV